MSHQVLEAGEGSVSRRDKAETPRVGISGKKFLFTMVTILLGAKLYPDFINMGQANGQNS
jgi:hypothetical protein